MWRRGSSTRGSSARRGLSRLTSVTRSIGIMRSYRPNIVSGLAYIEISITSAMRPHVECEIEPIHSGGGRWTPPEISIRSLGVVVATVVGGIDVDVDVVFGVQ